MNRHFARIVLARTTLIAAIVGVGMPQAALAVGPQNRKPQTTVPGNTGVRSPRQAATRDRANAAKTTVQRGKPTLQEAKGSLQRAIVRADALKPVREQLRGQVIANHNAYLANPNAQTRAAWKSSVASYMPVRQAHEEARTRRDAAISRYKSLKSQMGEALARTNAAGAEAVRPPVAGRPVLRRQARFTVKPTFAAAAESPSALFTNGTGRSLPPIPVASGQAPPPVRQYDRVPSFRNEVIQYSSLRPDNPNASGSLSLTPSGRFARSPSGTIEILRSGSPAQNGTALGSAGQ